MKLVIGLLGEKGSGKETFFRLLKQIVPKKSVQSIKFSKLLSDTLKIWAIPKSRKNLQKLGLIMEKGFGKGALAFATKKLILQLKSQIIIVDGIRRQAEFDMIKSFPKSYTVYITSDPKIRYQRSKERGEKTKESYASFKQFMEDEKVKTEILIPKLGKKADFKIVNNGTLADFKKQVEKFLAKFRLLPQ